MNHSFSSRWPEQVEAQDGFRTNEDWNHLLSVRWRKRDSRFGTRRGVGGPRPRSPFHQLRTTLSTAGECSTTVLPSGRYQRLRIVQVSRLHAAFIRQDG